MAKKCAKPATPTPTPMPQPRRPIDPKHPKIGIAYGPPSPPGQKPAPKPAAKPKPKGPGALERLGDKLFPGFAKVKKTLK